MSCINLIKGKIGPKKYLEWLITSSLFIVSYFYLYIYQNMLHIKIKFLSIQDIQQPSIITLFILPLILYIIVKSDPLARKPYEKIPIKYFQKEIKFFQNEFPSKYILARCERCSEDENSCPNYIKKESYGHVKYWFYDIFHGEIEKENPGIIKETFRKGYTCKLIFYLSWTLIILLISAIITIVIYHLYLYYYYHEFKFELSTSQAIFPIVCISLLVLIRLLNNPNNTTPSGCWHAWRQINRIHIFWLKDHEDFLVNLICKKGSCIKRFREK